MESQKSRFDREWMEIRDDRKVRGFDQQSPERKDRIMPGRLSEEESFGFSGTLKTYEGEIKNEGPAEGVLFTFIESNLSNYDFTDYWILSPQQNITITNSKIQRVTSEEKELNFNGEISTFYPMTFNNCTLLFGGENAIPFIKGSVFNNCNMFDFQDSFMNLVISITSTKQEALDAFNLYMYPEGTEYNNCKVIDPEKYFE